VVRCSLHAWTARSRQPRPFHRFRTMPSVTSGRTLLLAMLGLLVLRRNRRFRGPRIGCEYVERGVGLPRRAHSAAAGRGGTSGPRLVSRTRRDLGCVVPAPVAGMAADVRIHRHVFRAPSSTSSAESPVCLLGVLPAQVRGSAQGCTACTGRVPRRTVEVFREKTSTPD